MASFRSLDALSPKGRRVLVRVDLNVPMRDGEISDTSRIERVAETLNSLADGGARVVVISHFGRPRGVAAPSLSLRPLAEPLSRALGGRPVGFVGGCIGGAPEPAVAA
ncbi:MAG: phosphoglycerate kinase, partial [Proteobacteria bacterium]|nr:phosphoglycerate kinase [Pseudomonadota bacterium]